MLISIRFICQLTLLFLLVCLLNVNFFGNLLFFFFLVNCIMMIDRCWGTFGY